MKVLTVTPNPALDLSVTAPSWARGEVNVAQAAQFDAGGKGVNVASFLADWWAGGAKQGVAATGFLGQDNAGPFETLFTAKGIGDEFVRLPGSTRLGIKITAEAGDTTDFNLPGLAATTADAEALQGRVTALASGAAAAVLAGSLPPGLPSDFYAQLCVALRQAGCGAVAADTSGPALNALSALPPQHFPHLLKPNIQELEAALGRALPDSSAQLQAARELLARGAQWVAVSLGAEGAYLVTAQGAWHAQPPQVNVQSTVGAGDAMVAGLLSSLLEGLAPPDALRRATAFSAGSITQLGAHLPPKEELRRLEGLVSLTPQPS